MLVFLGIKHAISSIKRKDYINLRDDIIKCSELIFFNVLIKMK